MEHSNESSEMQRRLGATSKKRRLHYEDTMTNFEHVESPKSGKSSGINNVKRSRISFRHPRKSDWDFRMDGFDDLAWNLEKNRNCRHRAKTGTETWECNNQDENLSDIESISPEKSQVKTNFILNKSPQIEGSTGVSPDHPEKSSKNFNLHLNNFNMKPCGTLSSGQRVKRWGKFKQNFQSVNQKCNNEEDVAIEAASPVSLKNTKFMWKKQEMAEQKQKTTGSETSQGTGETEAAISDYESDPDEPQSIHHEKLEEMHNVSTSQSPAISDATPSNEIDTKEEKRQKGSDWLKIIQWQEVTPEKPQMDTSEITAHDSAKKRKPAFSKGGLAESLQKVITRERSALAFWTHKMTNPASSKCLLVKVVKCQVLCSVMLTHCYSETEAQQLDVLFTCSLSKQLNIQEGTTIRIHPPWQRLRIPQQKDLVLCTSFCEVASQSPSTPAPSGDVTVHSKVIASWDCPCQSDPYVPKTTCPAHLYPCDTRRKLHSNNKETVTLGEKLSKHRDSKLSTVACTQVDCQEVQSESILDSIEKSGGCTATSIGFTAIVQRLYQRTRWHALVQDHHGMFCEVQLPVDSDTRPCWSQLVHHGEGQMYIFSGLQVYQRTNKARSPGLFSLIGSLWIPQKQFTHRCSQLQSQESEYPAASQAPTFCYLVTATSDSQCRPLVTEGCKQEGGDADSLYQPARSVSLAEISQVCSDRITVCAQLVYCRPKSKENGNMRWFITCSTEDTTGYSQVYTLSVHNSCVTACSISPTANAARSIYNLRDIQVTDVGHLLADGYTVIQWMGASNDQSRRLLEHPVSLPPLTVHSTAHTLATVQGTVAAVDEATAYTWSVCPYCSDDKLVGSTAHNPFLYCTSCKKPVAEPDRKIHLEIFVTTPLEDTSVKVQLLQSTIETLLPQETDEEGYDVQCVLNKAVGPLFCYIQSVHRPPSRETIFVLEEIKLL